MRTGAWLSAASAVLALIVGFVLRPRLPAGAVAGMLLVAGVGIGWGGMLLQPDPSIGEVVAALGMLAFLVPVHVRIVLGPFGPTR